MSVASGGRRVIVFAWKKGNRFAFRRYSLKNKLGDRMIKQLLNSIIAKYRDLPVSRTSIICLCLRLRQISARHWQITIFCSTSTNNCQVVVLKYESIIDIHPVIAKLSSKRVNPFTYVILLYFIFSLFFPNNYSSEAEAGSVRPWNVVVLNMRQCSALCNLQTD